MKKALELLDVKSGVVLSVYTATIIFLSVHATLTKTDLPSGVVTAYLGVVGAFTYHGVKKNDAAKPPETIIG